AASSKVLFVGASSINQKVLKHFKAKGISNITLCNRSLVSEEIEEKFQIKILPWKQLSLWREYDWIICGTKATHHILIKEAMPAKEHSKKLLIDLGLPRNIDPLLEKEPFVYLY